MTRRSEIFEEKPTYIYQGFPEQAIPVSLLGEAYRHLFYIISNTREKSLSGQPVAKRPEITR